MTRLASSIVVSGLLRAAEATGGNGTVIAKGDPSAGAILVVLTQRGADPMLFERASSLTKGFMWNQRNSAESMTSQRVAQLIAQMKRFDRDLWAVDLDVANVEQFIVDSLGET